jgi:hypothetical protein
MGGRSIVSTTLAVIDQKCFRLASAKANTVQLEPLSSIALAALTPIPFGWLLGYVVFGLTRWVRRGFSPSQ